MSEYPHDVALPPREASVSAVCANCGGRHQRVSGEIDCLSVGLRAERARTDALVFEVSLAIERGAFDVCGNMPSCRAEPNPLTEDQWCTSCMTEHKIGEAVNAIQRARAAQNGKTDV